MTTKQLASALAAGVALFLAVGVAVTELARPRIEFSLFLGIPAGLAAGALAAVAVYLGLADEAPPRRRRIADTVVGGAAGFLVGLVAVGWLFGVGLTLALLVAAVTAALGAALTSRRGRNAA